MNLFSVIDIGTNTFQLLVTERTPTGFRTVFETSQPARIGEGGISAGFITEEAITRAVGVLQAFRNITDGYGISPEKIIALGTSAIRNAQNQKEFQHEILQKTGIKITIIPGEEEAQLIYEGVRAGVPLSAKTSLIVDIGGGSVEFILANEERIFWKQSFEIGGQRLMDKFHQTDPILPDALSRLNDYLTETLLPLTNAVHQYEPIEIIGCAGSFETLVDMHLARNGEIFPSESPYSELPLASFIESYQSLITQNRTERNQQPGMTAYRVDMIVVGVGLIAFLVKHYGLEHIRVSNFAMKEGMAARIASRGSKF